MAQNKETKEYEIKGHKLACPICNNTNFWTRKSLLNTKGLTLLELDWANKQADNYICDKCGYVMWFLQS
jgi:predicted nucleic-acid-binding Zn-ribbon protein